jgi:hypothetical protein
MEKSNQISKLKSDYKNKKPRHVAENHGTNFFHIKSWVLLTSNVKKDQCCPQLRFSILMVRLYNSFITDDKLLPISSDLGPDYKTDGYQLSVKMSNLFHSFTL